MELCNQDNIEKFIKEVSDANIYDQLNPALNTNPNYNYKILSKVLQTAKSRHIPKKIRKFNKRKHTKEKWMTRELLTEVVKKTKLYVEWKTTSVTHVNYHRNKQRLKEHEKETLKKIREAKKQYFDRIFTAYKANIKKTWKTINETLNRNKNGSELPSRFLHNDVEILDPKDIATAFMNTLKILEKTLHLKLTILAIITVISSTYIIRQKKDSNLNVLPRMKQQK